MLAFTALSRLSPPMGLGTGYNVAVDQSSHLTRRRWSALPEHLTMFAGATLAVTASAVLPSCRCRLCAVCCAVRRRFARRRSARQAYTMHFFRGGGLDGQGAWAFFSRSLENRILNRKSEFVKLAQKILQKLYALFRVDKFSKRVLRPIKRMYMRAQARMLRKTEWAAVPVRHGQGGPRAGGRLEYSAACTGDRTNVRRAMGGGRQVEPTQAGDGRTAGGMDGRREGGKGNIMPCYVAFYVRKGT